MWPGEAGATEQPCRLATKLDINFKAQPHMKLLYKYKYLKCIMKEIRLYYNYPIILQTLAKHTCDMSYLERRQKEGEEETGPTAFYLRPERSSHRPLPRKIVRAFLFTLLKFSKHCLVKEN